MNTMTTHDVWFHCPAALAGAGREMEFNPTKHMMMQTTA